MSKLQKILEENGYECQSYSGRSMYGKECLGVTIDRRQNLFSLGILVGKELEPGDYDEIDSVGTDSMGMGTIIYWPGIEYVESVSVSEDEDNKIRELMEKRKEDFKDSETGEIDAFFLAEDTWDYNSKGSGRPIPANYLRVAKEIANGT